MKLKYTGTRTHEYHGIDGLGGMLNLKRGDECEVSETVATKLMQHYRADFHKLDDEKEHAPGANKMLAKGIKYKSK